MNNEQRWLQRFENFESAYAVFLRRIDEYEQFPDKEAYQMALIQGFEIIIELAWKTLKDYLENEGYSEVKNAKQTVRQAFQDEIIRDAEAWMGALEKRNLTSHVYNVAILHETLDFIHDRFYPVLKDLFFKLKDYRDTLSS
jgi:nucleotidyltransferase substrate binding protein (TIGR01987 family)